jgi:hypothetical protein
LTVDVKPASARLAVPGTWNRYQYAGDDPINAYDPTGMFLVPVGTDCEQDDEDSWDCVVLYEDDGSPGGPVGQGVGGGGGESYEDRLRARLHKLLESLRGTNCDKVLSAAGVSISYLEQNAAQAEYVLAQNAANESMSQLTGGLLADTESVAQWAAGPAASGAIALTVDVTQSSGAPWPTPGNIYALELVVLTSLWPGSTSDWQDYTLLHEDLHYSMQTDDQGILKDFGITQTDPTTGDPLTNWLMKGCQN